MRWVTDDAGAPLSEGRARARFKQLQERGGSELERNVARQQLERARRRGERSRPRPNLVGDPLDSGFVEGDLGPRAERKRLANGLTAADVEWLRRLPIDVNQVSVEDARTVVQMYRAASDSGDQRLLASIAEPLIAYHDRATRLANARETVDFYRGRPDARDPRIPYGRHWSSDEVDLVASSILDGTDDLTWDEARARARSLLDEVRLDQEVRIEAEVRDAQAILKELGS